MMDMNLLREAITVLTMGAFGAVVWWAYAPSRKDVHQEHALLPFDKDEQ
jgi:cbb3-type cytochrome oxidase subunit 3